MLACFLCLTIVICTCIYILHRRRKKKEQEELRKHAMELHLKLHGYHFDEDNEHSYH